MQLATFAIRQVVLDAKSLFREQYGHDLVNELLARSALSPYTRSFLVNALFDCVVRRSAECRTQPITDADCHEVLWQALEDEPRYGAHIRAVIFAMIGVRFACTWRVPEDEPVYVLTCPIGTNPGPNLWPVPMWFDREPRVCD
jgi:hypothetical protein